MHTGPSHGHANAGRTGGGSSARCSWTVWLLVGVFVALMCGGWYAVSVMLLRLHDTQDASARAQAAEATLKGALDLHALEHTKAHRELLAKLKALRTLVDAAADERKAAAADTTADDQQQLAQLQQTNSLLEAAASAASSAGQSASNARDLAVKLNTKVEALEKLVSELQAKESSYTKQLQQLRTVQDQYELLQAMKAIQQQEQQPTPTPPTPQPPTTSKSKPTKPAGRNASPPQPPVATEEASDETGSGGDEDAAVVAAPAPAAAANRALSDLAIVWDFGSCGCTGWAMETIVFVMELAPQLPKLAIIAGEGCFCPGLPDSVRTTLDRLQHPNPPISAWDHIDVFISHKPASRYPVWPYRGEITIRQRPTYVIGRSMIETHSLPHGWRDRIARDVDEVWLPSTFLIDVFRTGGVPPQKLFVIPEAVDLTLYNPDTVTPFPLPPLPPLPAAAAGAGESDAEGTDTDRHDAATRRHGKRDSRRRHGRKRVVMDTDTDGDGEHDAVAPPAETETTEAETAVKSFRFFSLFKWEDRKGWDVLLRAFFTEFSPLDDVALYIHTYLYGESDWNRRNVDRVFARIREFVATLPAKCTAEGNRMFGAKCEFPELRRQVVVMTDELETAAMPSLYRAMHAFVLPTHGEGWGLPIMEAMAMALPTLATNWSGPTDFMTPTNSYPIPITGLVPATGRDFERGQQWAAPDVTKLQKLMRHVVTHRDEAVARGKQARADLQQYFSPKVVSDLLLARLQAIADTGVFDGVDTDEQSA